MSLDIALVLRLVNKLSNPIKQPTGDVAKFGETAERAQDNLRRFGMENADTQKLSQLSQLAERAGFDMSAMAVQAETGVHEIAAMRGDIEHFRLLKREVDQTGSALEQTQARAKDLAGQLNQGRGDGMKGGDLRALERDFNNTKEAARQLKETHLSQRRSLDLLRGNLRGAGVDTRDLSGATKELNRREREHVETMRHRERIASRLSGQQERLNRLNERGQTYAQRRGQLRGAALETAAIGYGAMRFVQGAMQSQSKLAEIAITGEMDDGQRAALKDYISTTRKQVSGSQREGILGSMQQLTAAAFETEVAMAALGPIAKTAIAGFASAEDVTSSSIAILKNMGVEHERLQAALDMQAMGGARGSFEIKDMAAELPAITAIARSQNMHGEEGLASLIAAAQVAREGTDTGASAAVLMTNLLGKIDAPDTVRNFEKFDIDLIERLEEYDAAGINRLEAITKLSMEARGTGARVSQLFGDRETKRMVEQMMNGWDLYQSLKTEIMNDSAGAVDAMHQKRMGIDQSLKIIDFQEDAKEARDNVGISMLPAITQGLERAAPALEGIGSYAAANPEMITMATQAAMALAALRLTTLAVGFAFNTIAGPALLARAGILRVAMASGTMKLGVIAAMPWLNRMAYGFGALTGRALNFAFGLSSIARFFSRAGSFTLRWSTMIKMLTWSNFIRPIGWKILAGPLRWGGLIGALAWSRFLPKIAWGAAAGKLGWGTLITALKWGSRLIPVISWATLLLPLAWDYIIKPLGWDKYLPKIAWDGWVPKLIWPDWINDLKWSDVIKQSIEWASYILPFSWIAMIGKLIWTKLIDRIDWDGWFSFEWKSLLPDWDWSKIITALPDFGFGKWFGGDNKITTPSSVPIDGARAAGGPVRAGGTYLVGERGPELLRMGSQPGLVIPSALSMALLSAPASAAAPELFEDLKSAQSEIRIAPRPQLSPRRANHRGPVKIDLRVEAGAVTIQVAPGSAPEQIGQAALNALADQLVPQLERAIARSSGGDDALHDASELFDE